MRRAMAFYKGLDRSRGVEFARYALNRVIDVFVIGPAAIAAAAVLATWLGGGQPFYEVAKGQAAIGEAFRDAPPGYVMVPHRPAYNAGKLPDSPTVRVSTDGAQRRPVPVEEWIQDQAQELGQLYLLGVTMGLFVVIGLRGWRLLASPWLARSKV